ncbi:MAG: hypothetical protein RL693_679 [Verrucomicrobiota bacterium]|jgi:zinc transport system substrate-binding protein
MFKQGNQMLLKHGALAVLLGISVIASCKQAEQATVMPDGDKGLLKVAVANYPLAYFAERIGGTEVKVIYRIPAETDPAFWEPSASDIAEFQGADLILMNGATYSKWADKASLPASKVVDTSTAFSDQFIEVKNGNSHSHGKQGEHSHDGTAFTTWIDFMQAVQQADAVSQALQKLRPSQVELFALNFDLLKQDIMALDSAMKETGQKLQGQPIIASHPVYQYWARRYQIDLRSLLWEPDVAPTNEQISELKKLIQNQPARWFVWEGTPMEQSVEKLKILGLESVTFAPCGNKPESGNWLSVMKDNLANIQKITEPEQMTPGAHR